MQTRIAVFLQNNGTHELVRLVYDLGAEEIAVQLAALGASADVNIQGASVDVNIHGEGLRTNPLRIMRGNCY